MICDDQHDHQDAAERVHVVQVARDRELDELPVHHPHDRQARIEPTLNAALWNVG
jgi:hypothetical protein